MRHRAEQLRKMGYSILLPSENNYLNMDGPRESWSDFIGAQLRSGASENGRAQRKSIPTLYFSSGNEVKTGVSDKGTKDLGYIEWGLGNTLPNLVALLTNMLPYTAAGVEFNQMLVTGLGHSRNLTWLSMLVVTSPPRRYVIRMLANGSVAVSSTSSVNC